MIFALARTRRERRRAGGGRHLHRCRLLLHELDQLRQPGHRRRAHVLQHVRGDRAVVGPDVHRAPRSLGGLVAVRFDAGRSIPVSGRAEAAQVVLPHESSSTADARVTPTSGGAVLVRPQRRPLADGRRAARSARSVGARHRALRRLGSDGRLNPAVVAAMAERGARHLGQGAASRSPTRAPAKPTWS